MKTICVQVCVFLLLFALAGCPTVPQGPLHVDSDGDGVFDSVDRCPRTPRGARVDNKGCELDSDGDGVADSRDRCPDSESGARIDFNGCEIKAEIRLPSIQFETGSVLTQHSIAILQDVVATLTKYPDLNVVIEGHTDNSGMPDDNMALSKNRAIAVSDFLMEQGIDRCRRLQAVGYGETQPIASNETDEGKRLNNRASIRPVDEQTPFSALPKFTPWPPPSPSSRVPLSQSFFAADGNLKNVADRLEDALRVKQYEYSFYRVPACGDCGFALVTRLERILEDGSPADPNNRFLPINEQGPVTFASYLKRLFKAPTGYYRFIIFFVTDQMPMPDELSPPMSSAKEAEKLLTAGGFLKPNQNPRCGFARKNVEAFIYEFRKEPGRETVEIIEGGRLDVYTHFSKAGLERLLNGRLGD